jgi:hypothetical protein
MNQEQMAILISLIDDARKTKPEHIENLNAMHEELCMIYATSVAVATGFGVEDASQRMH